MLGGKTLKFRVSEISGLMGDVEIFLKKRDSLNTEARHLLARIIEDSNDLWYLIPLETKEH